MAGRVDGKVAVVTGAGSSGPGVGVGKAISVLFAREGARVLLVDQFADRAAETLQLVEQEGGQASVFEVDITEATAAERIRDEALARFGTIDILVNNAAISPLVALLDTSPEVYERVMAINATAPFMITKAVLPVMIAHGGGSVVNITSVAAFRGTGASQTAYSASKAALLGLAVDVANNYGRQGIRINTIAPGHIATPMRDMAGAAAGIDIAKLNAAERTAVGFEGDAWDIARAALFLASDDARFITGVLLPVDGGTTTRNP